MNERIRELMIRAIADVDSINDPETKRMYIPNCFAERFTELIVRECMKVSRGADGLDATHEAWYLIKEHFGVKE